MKRTIDRVYVVDHAHPDPHSHAVLSAAEAQTIMDQVEGELRMFVEARPWFPAKSPPDNRRRVMVCCKSPVHLLPQLIFGRFGSEGKWVAEDHDGRLTYLDPWLVVGWQETPTLPEVL